MKRKIKDEDIFLKIDDLRKKISVKIKDEASKEYREAQKSGKFPWEGMWLIPEDIQKIQKELKRKDKIIFTEIILIMFFLTFLGYILFLFLSTMLPE
jgi:hypothetical protein